MFLSSTERSPYVSENSVPILRPGQSMGRNLEVLQVEKRVNSRDQWLRE